MGFSWQTLLICCRHPLGFSCHPLGFGMLPACFHLPPSRYLLPPSTCSSCHPVDICCHPMTFCNHPLVNLLPPSMFLFPPCRVICCLSLALYKLPISPLGFTVVTCSHPLGMCLIYFAYLTTFVFGLNCLWMEPRFLRAAVPASTCWALGPVFGTGAPWAAWSCSGGGWPGCSSGVSSC